MRSDHDFEAERERLQGLAYRMTGSVSDAEDIVQDAWLRWQSCDKNEVENPQRFITRIVSNLSLDRIRANKKHRETYVGSWLPEPSLDRYPAPNSANPEYAEQLADDLTVAFMLTLERLTPNERLAFVLHDVFAYDFGEIANILKCTPASCRKLASRARKAFQDGKSRCPVTKEEGYLVASTFQKALADGDLTSLTKLLSKDTQFISDGGGKVTAVPLPVDGAAKVAKMIIGFAGLYRNNNNVHSTLTTINGLPGFILWDGQKLIQALMLEINADNLIDKIYVVRNPDKLSHLQDLKPGEPD